MKLPFRVVDTDLEHPYFVTAADEAIARSRGEGIVPDTLHFYRRDPAGISVGYFQVVKKDVDVEACRREGVVIVRRTSGGGTIYTDKGQLIYGIATGKRLGRSIEEAFKLICGLIITVLGSNGIEAEYKPPNDILVNGKKISGNAQTIKDNVTLQHGTIILDMDTEKMAKVLREKKPGYVSSVKAETGIHIDITRFKTEFTETLAKTLGEEFVPGELVTQERELIDKLIAEKYGNDSWNFKR